MSGQASKPALRGLVEGTPPRTLLAVMAAAVALTALAGYLYGFRKPVAELARLEQMHSQSEKEVAAERAAADETEIARLEAQVDHLHETLYGSRAGVPANQLVSHIIGELDRLAARHGVQLVSVKPGTPDSVLMFKELPFDVEASGGYFALHDWLADAERELRPLVVKQFQIRSTAPDSPLRMTLRVVSYRFEGEES